MAGPLDQFRQLRRDRVAVQVTVAGVDVSTRFNPRLLLLSVRSLYGTSAMDEARLELDDKLGQIVMPEGSDDIVISLGWPHEGSFGVFTGTVADIESFGQKNGGRIMAIVATGHDLVSSKAKTPMRWSLGDGTEDQTLGDAIGKAAKLAGFDIRIAPELGSIKRKFWMAANESFQAIGDRIATEVGGAFKIQGKQATLTKVSSGQSADGQNLATLTAQAGVNLIAWDIHPREARPQWKSTGAMFFDVAKGVWTRVAGKIPIGGNTLTANADFTHIGAAADEAEAGQKAAGDAALVYRHRGFGWVVTDGEPTAQGGCTVNISGARPGVDGTYKSSAVEHFLTRQTGYICRVDVDSIAPGKAQEAF